MLLKGLYLHAILDWTRFHTFEAVNAVTVRYFFHFHRLDTEVANSVTNGAIGTGICVPADPNDSDLGKRIEKCRQRTEIPAECHRLEER